MTTAAEAYRAGRLDAAIAALGAELREDAGDLRSRTFLFELLCFAGLYDRAERQLDVLGQLGGAEMRVELRVYRAALDAERRRQETFRDAPAPVGRTSPAPAGRVNGRSFQAIADADPRVGLQLEFLAADLYCAVSLHEVASVHAAPPVRLRDLLWIPAELHLRREGEVLSLGEVLLPALSPLTWQHPSDPVRLGRETHWEVRPDGTEILSGQKLLLTDEEEIPFLEIRELQITPAGGAAA